MTFEEGNASLGLYPAFRTRNSSPMYAAADLPNAENLRLGTRAKAVGESAPYEVTEFLVDGRALGEVDPDNWTGR